MPDDETVNQMIARSEEEFEQFMVSPNSLSIIREVEILQSDSIQPPAAFYICSSAWILTDAVRKPVTRKGNLV